MKKKINYLFFVSVVLLFLVIINGCDLMPSGNQVTVEMLDEAFIPQDIVIKSGTTVRWINSDMHHHTVTSGIRDSEDAGDLFDMQVEANQEFSYTFQIAGTYPYFCRIHPGMNGTVTVTE